MSFAKVCIRRNNKVLLLFNYYRNDDCKKMNNLFFGAVVRECKDGEVRLVGGENEREGRVEICYNGV